HLCGTPSVRLRADMSTRALEPEQDAERARFLRWWFGDEGRRFGIEGEMPAAQGDAVARTLEAQGAEIPAMPDEAGNSYADARRADALSALVAAHIAQDPD